MFGRKDSEERSQEESDEHSFYDKCHVKCEYIGCISAIGHPTLWYQPSAI